MKRILIFLAVILLVAAMLAGCVSIKVNARGSDTPAPATPESAPTPKELTRGVIEGNVYINESAELTFTAPEGWEYADDETIGAFAGTGAGASDGTNTCDMLAFETSARASIAVAYQYLVADELFYDEEVYMEEMKNGPNNNVEFGYYPDYKIGPNTFKVMTIYYADHGSTQYYYIHRTGDYMLCIIATPSENSDIGSIMANFS